MNTSPLSSSSRDSLSTISTDSSSSLSTKSPTKGGRIVSLTAESGSTNCGVPTKKISAEDFLRQLPQKNITKPSFKKTTN